MRLLRDRYFEYAPDRAWDLVTGNAVTAPGNDDEDLPGGPGLGPLIELLDHGVDGSPRSMVVDASPRGCRGQVTLAATLARRRGYVPVAVDVYLRLRSLLDEDLRTRALVLIARPGTQSVRAHMALAHAAAMSPRPHLLLTFHTLADATRRWHVREARPVYGPRHLHGVAPARYPADVSRLVERAERAGYFVRAGRHAAAERLLRDVAAALVRRRALEPAAQTYIDLGRLLLERGRALAADSAFAEAARQAEGAAPRLALGARTWQAAARTDSGQLASAESLCRAVLAADLLDEQERGRTEATLARVLTWQGRAAAARSLDFVARRLETADAFTHATAVQVLLERGEIFDAGGRARMLLDATANVPDSTARVIALGAQFRLLLATGDLTLAGEALRAVTAAARAARTPIRLLRMRLLWAQALRRAGRKGDADREWQMLARMRLAVPPLLRGAIDRGLHDTPPIRIEQSPGSSDTPNDDADLVFLAQRDEDDARTLEAICAFVMRAAHASRVELWTSDAGPATAVVSTGSGLATRLGARTLEAGIIVGPEPVESGSEIASPVLLGTSVIAALAVRWPADRIHTGQCMRLVTLACAVAAPRVESMLQARRHLAQAATAIPELVGVSQAIADVRVAVSRAAAAPFSVLIEGESGVGKELVARAIHHLGPRRDRRFCDVNCAALPDELLESELFGHTRGAFTGAVADRAGLVEDADGGTLFLDEVADLSGRAQAKLLRVVQQQEVRRVGETFSRTVDVRFVCAANRDLRLESEHGRFRQDLLYRLDVIRIRVPPLRHRPEDIPVLAHHFWTACSARVGTRATLSHGVLAALARYQWPGNIRELQNVMAALAVEAPARGQVRAALLPGAITGAAAVTSARLSDARTQWERRFVEIALARAGGNRSRAARELGLTRQGLMKVLERLNLADEGGRPSTKAT